MTSMHRLLDDIIGARERAWWGREGPRKGHDLLVLTPAEGLAGGVRGTKTHDLTQEGLPNMFGYILDGFTVDLPRGRGMPEMTS